MNRREFLSAAALGGVAAAGLEARGDGGADKRMGGGGVLAEPPGGVEYFSQGRLERAIDVTKPLGEIDFELVAFVCNLWHPTPVLERWFGKGFSEWELCRRARPQFEGHYQPKRPSWGCYKEAEVGWAGREIDLAASAGVDVFMVDWYWHSGEMFLHEWLEQGFLKSPNCAKMKFAVMWANHHWTNFYLAPEEGEEAVLLPQVYSEGDMDRVCEYLIEHYFTRPNYWKIDGKCVFSIFWGRQLVEHFGAGKLHRIFDGWQDRARKSGLKGIHFQSAADHPPGAAIVEAGFDSATDYHTFPCAPDGGKSSFAAGAERAIGRWAQAAGSLRVPYFADAPVGWDNSPRYGRKAHVVTGRTADQFERLLVAAKHFTAGRGMEPAVIFTGAWNEWTEDHYLLPDEVHGYSYLEAVRRQFG